MSHEKIRLFDQQKIRTQWDEKKQKWFFSIVDVIEVLVGSSRPRKYWNDMKTKLIHEGNGLIKEIGQLKMQAADGKQYLTDVADTELLLRIVQVIPSPKAEPFKLWLAPVMFGDKPSYVDYLTSREFVDDVASATRADNQRLALDISSQTRDVIASSQALAAENIRATESMGDSLKEGMTRLSYDMQEISSGVSKLNATFHWGFGQAIATIGRMSDTLEELLRIAKTPAQNAAYEQYEIARDAFRQGLYLECIESLDKAISGDHTSAGYKLGWRFHQMKGTLRLGFVNGDMSLIDLAQAEESFALAARYARADYPDHAAQALLSAGWAAYCQGKMKEGLVHTEQALAINPELGEALFQAAKVHVALGEMDAALPLLGRAIDLDRFYSLKAAGDGDFQQHDDKLRSFLDAMRKEKHRQSLPRVQEGLEQLQQIFSRSPDDSVKAAIKQLKEFLVRGESWPLLDMLSVVQRLDDVIAGAKRLPIMILLESSKTKEESYQEQESYQEKVVIKPGGLFKKAVTELQTKTRTVSKKRNVSTSVRFDFCPVPAGTFMMGDETCGPVHHVSISKHFHLGKYPVTQAQWEAVMGTNPSHFKNPDCPVETVSWEDCQEFIKRLNSVDKGCYRLPTEAEWEYACRAGSAGKYCFGDDEAQLGEYAWYSANSGNKTHPVGKKKPNSWGLHDMHGNVFEWCLDWHGDYSDDTATDPNGPSAGLYRVFRGGGWCNAASYATSSNRDGGVPGCRYNGFGFRLVLVSIG
jgi:formylglycine-generating enzyme required for sulfatase activity